MALPLALDDRRLDELLWLWERWMSSSQPYRDLWYPDGACGCVGGGYSQSFEDMVEAADSRAAEAVNGAIDSLKPIEQCAILHVHLHAVFRFREPLEAIYGRAREALRVALPSRGVY
jgi:hypothetical protein